MANPDACDSLANRPSYARALELFFRARLVLQHLPEPYLKHALTELGEAVEALELLEKLAADPHLTEAEAGLSHRSAPSGGGSLLHVVDLLSFVRYMQSQSYRVVRLGAEDAQLVTTLNVDEPVHARELEGLGVEFLLDHLAPRS